MTVRAIEFKPAEKSDRIDEIILTTNAETPVLPGVSETYDSLRNLAMTPAGQHPVHTIIGRLFRERWPVRRVA
jgi:hypothetical protein